jgi:hypothetical protein
MAHFCDWWLDSPHYFGNVVVLQGCRVFPQCREAEGAFGVMAGARTMAVMVKQTRESTNDNYAIDWWILTVVFFLHFSWSTGLYHARPPIYRGRRSSGSTSDCCGKNTNSSEHKRQNYATSGWVLTFFAAVVQRDCRTVPPSMEGQGALWGQWWEQVRFQMAEMGELIGDGMRQFCGRSKESHTVFLWQCCWMVICTRDGVTRFGSGVGLRAMFEVDGWNPMVRDCLWWQIWYRDLFLVVLLACPLDYDVVPWFALLPFTNDQIIQIKQ